MVLVLPLLVAACEMIPSKNIATVESVNYLAQTWGESGLVIYLKPTNVAKASIPYGVDLYESGRYRASVVVSWTDNELSVFTTKKLVFPIPLDEVGVYIDAGKKLEDVFSVKVHEPVVPSLTITFPNGGEHWYIGDTVTITWKSANLAKDTPLQIAVGPSDNSGSWVIIAGRTTNTGNYKWTVTGPVTTHAKVQIAALIPSSPPSTMSAADFTISAKP